MKNSGKNFRRNSRLLTENECVELHVAPYARILDLWEQLERNGVMRADLGRCDRYYLLVKLLRRFDALHPWLYEQCREVERSPDGHLDLWAREHYKSTIITFAGSIQEIVRDPEITIGIFSHVKSISRDFVAQIKREFEGNAHLKATYPDVLWDNPQREAPSWSVDNGLIVRRQSNPKECTVEGHGLVDGQPTAMHFKLLIYDDVVTRESVTTPEQVKKTTEAWSLSDNLGAASGADGTARKWHIGTRYSFADTYQHMLSNKILVPRIKPATADGTRDGKPVLLSAKAWAEKKKNQVSSILAAQMLQNPAAGNEALFDREWLRFADIRPETVNVYIMVDPASSQKKGSDNTAIAVVLVGAGGVKLLVDGYYHKMRLAERWRRLRDLYATWSRMRGVQTINVGYERYGSMADLDYFEEQMQVPGVVGFPIRELAWPRGGEVTKYDRVQRLEPDFRNGRIYLVGKYEGDTANQRRMRAEGQPWRTLKPVKRYDHERQIYALNKVFLDEYLSYPFSVHDDFLDALSRIYDMDPAEPMIVHQRDLEPEVA